MKKLYITLALVAVAIAFYNVFFHKEFKKEAAVTPTRYSSIVRLTKNGDTFCSGTVISNDLLITAAHCVLEMTIVGERLTTDIIKIRPSNNQDLKIVAKPVKLTSKLDQAIMVGDFHQFNSRPYFSKPEDILQYRVAGQEFISCGYPMGGNMYCTPMVFVKANDFAWFVDGVLIPGMSGGPMMVNGTVVAVNSAVQNEFAVVSPIYNILNLLRK